MLHWCPVSHSLQEPIIQHTEALKGLVKRFVYLFSMMTFNVPDNLCSPIQQSPFLRRIKALKKSLMSLLTYFMSQIKCENIFACVHQRPYFRLFNQKPIFIKLLTSRRGTRRTKMLTKFLCLAYKNIPVIALRSIYNSSPMASWDKVSIVYILQNLGGSSWSFGVYSCIINVYKFISSNNIFFRMKCPSY